MTKKRQKRPQRLLLSLHRKVFRGGKQPILACQQWEQNCEIRLGIFFFFFEALDLILLTYGKREFFIDGNQFILYKKS